MDETGHTLAVESGLTARVEHMAVVGVLEEHAVCAVEGAYGSGSVQSQVRCSALDARVAGTVVAVTVLVHRWMLGLLSVRFAAAAAGLSPVALLHEGEGVTEPCTHLVLKVSAEHTSVLDTLVVENVLVVRMWLFQLYKPPLVCWGGQQGSADCAGTLNMAPRVPPSHQQEQRLGSGLLRSLWLGPCKQTVQRLAQVDPQAQQQA